MKKFISILLILSMLFVFASCGKPTNTTEESTTDTSAVPKPEETTLQEMKGEDLLEMMDVADTQMLHDLNSGLYLLFLAPVLTASIKLLTDMAVFLIMFMQMQIV